MGEVITLAVGQAGCQGAASLLQVLADESRLGGGDSNSADRSAAAKRFFVPAAAGPRARPAARAVLLDMEPQVVAAACAAAQRSGAWQYARGAACGAQAGGCANNWAAGALRHAPVVRAQALGALRRQAERCDRLSGFLVMQSAAGGTGSGLGSAMVQAVRDDFPSCRILNHCVWPFEGGEVVTAPYNCVLTLDSLCQHSDGVIVAENSALAAVCQRQLGIPRPDFADLNAVAARSLASLLLPCTVQAPPSVSAGSNASGPGGGGRGRGGGSRGGGRQARPEWDAAPAPAAPTKQPAPAAAAWDGSFSSGSRWGDDEEAAGRGGSSRPSVGSQLDAFADVCQRLCSRPGHRLLSLHTCPQLPPSSVDFTPFSWPSVLRDLRQMQAAGRVIEAGAALPAGSRAARGSGSGGQAARLPSSNKVLANLLVIRGDGAPSADAACLADPSLYSSAALEQQAAMPPLAVAASAARLGQQQMLATLLSNDQAAAAPAARALDRAALLFGPRAYMHHYERHGLSCGDFEEALESVRGIIDNYRLL
ncbi:hypothetical protein ABPG75_006374 [Micractinium tetrahymenae]